MGESMSGARLAGNCLIETGACGGTLGTLISERKAEGASSRLPGEVLVCEVVGIRLLLPNHSNLHLRTSFPLAFPLPFSRYLDRLSRVSSVC